MNTIINELCNLYFEIYNKSKKVCFLDKHRSEFQYARTEIVDILNQTEYYHGTGAYHYEYDNTKYEGELKRIQYSLESILSQGIVPQRDFFNDIFETGSEKTVSLTNLQPYARCYANLFLSEREELQYTYGPSQFWGWVVAARIVIYGAIEKARRYIREERGREEPYKSRRDFFWPNYRTMLKGWTRSFRRDGKYEGKNFLFALGANSDIAGNFGIVIGIKKGIVNPLPIKYKSVALHEIRTDKPISPAEYTHIQVPIRMRAKVKEELIRAGLNIPVIPIEFVELINSELGFSNVLRARRID